MNSNDGSLAPPLDNLIVSVSGWRKIFTPVEEGYKSSLRSLCEGVHIRDEDFLLMFYAVTSYCDVMMERWSDTRTPYAIAFGRDTRATGESMLEAAMHAVRVHSHAEHMRIVPMGVLSAPQIMAYTRMHADGFVYITASHNPADYNGIKFGSADGAVLQRCVAQSIIARFFSEYAPRVCSELEPVKMRFYDVDDLRTMCKPSEVEDARAYEAYAQTVLQAVFRGVVEQGSNGLDTMQDIVRQRVRVYRRPLGILWDTNGGARSTAFDEVFLHSVGIHTKRIHTDCGVFVHEIIPEGSALEDARSALVACNQGVQDGGMHTFYPVALVSDCDGDRGNIIFYDERSPQCTRVMKAQEVFVFVLSIELAWQRLFSPDARLAVVINGPSTMRCEIIASRYNCDVVRVEVGEANVVAKAQQLRDEGYIVPIVGEASNGGIIMHPSTVRDPLCTALSCMKLLLWREDFAAHAQWSESCAHEDVFAERITHLPHATATEVEDVLAKFEVPCSVSVHAVLQHVASHVTCALECLVSVFEQTGISVVRTVCRNFVGTTVRECALEKLKAQDIEMGGFGVYFYTAVQGTEMPCGFVWLRPSGTEPFVRLVAEVIGETSESLERALIHAWRDLVNEAVLQCAAKHA